jgi:signal peptidase I
MDLIWQQPVEFTSRWPVAFVALATLTLAYVPATWLLGGLVMPRVISQTATPFEAGDCLLTNRWSYLWSRPKPGDVVLYRFGGATLGRYIVESGEVVDRILAGPGDRLKWSDHSLIVNGEESRLRPLDPHWPGELAECTVPQRHYLVLPSSVPYHSDRVRCAVYRTANLVSEEDILGTTYVRHQPLTRFWWIR